MKAIVSLNSGSSSIKFAFFTVDDAGHLERSAGGKIEKILPMGPWINVMDPRFNLHLRADRLAEVYRVWKPTRTGDVFSIEGFAEDGELILQIFGYRKDTPAEPWNALVKALPRLEEALA